MSEIYIPEKVKLIAAITFSDENILKLVEKRLNNQYGKLDCKLEPYQFTHTEYYRDEMGENLKKTFVSFIELIDSANLPDIKIQTNKIEEEFSENQKRRVNIDPGYVDAAKLVLATTKDYSHRIYIAKGIYGDIHLLIHKGKYKPNPWTYPDFREDYVLNFFNDVRKIYLESLTYQ